LKLIVTVFLLMISLNSEAQLRCFDLFTQAEAESSQYYAEVIDSLNEKYNHFLFSKNISESLTPNLEGSSFSARTGARYQAFKLNRLLKKMKSADSWDRYDFEKFAKKLEQLSFLSDPSVTKGMTFKEKLLYRQARHSLLAKGLESFLFDGTKALPSFKRKVFNWVMTPFKDIYSRWTFMMFYMPKLDGAILPVEIAAKVAWSGVDANHDLLEPYMKHSQFKYFFNVFSASYNWTLVAAIFVGLPAYSYMTYSDLQEKGAQQVQILFEPLVTHSEQMAKTNYHELAREQSLAHFKADFRVQFGRDPNEAELAIVSRLRE